MQQQLKFTIVDVFAETARAGNQLAVVENADTLSGTAMLSIAREFNFSETTFVCARSDRGARVRIFTPAEELPFAGHPTLGTAWVLTGGNAAITLELDAGDVPVEFAAGVAWMVPPEAAFGAAIPAAEAAAVINVLPEDLDDTMPPINVRCGPLFRLIAVRDAGVLGRAHMSAPANNSLDGAAFVFCRGGHSDDADFAARMFFFDGTAVREDPATGSANSAFAAYLRRLGQRGHTIVEQGFEMGRPSRIYAELSAPLRVGGRVQPFGDGVLRLPV
jgi:trans-2,3-dihydro-3-hydroxyanthranilate isomerase